MAITHTDKQPLASWQVRETSAQLDGASEQALTAEEAAQGGTLDQLLSRCCSMPLSSFQTLLLLPHCRRPCMREVPC